jgi:LPS-assembly protein
VRPSLRLLPLSLAIGMLTIAHAKQPGQAGVAKHTGVKHPANEWVLCHGDAVPVFPGQPPVGEQADRANAPTEVQADAADLSKVDTSVFSGHVETRHADQWMFSDRMFYQHDLDTWQALGNVKYQDNSVRLIADRADGDKDKDITTLETTKYQLRDTRGNGKGKHGAVHASQEVYTDGTYSTCDVDKRDWEIHGDTLQLDRDTDIGTAHHATVRIGNVPVLYLPYFTFSLDNERKSGFLTPSFGYNSRNGFLFTLPYYFNLAPNYDATLTGRLYGDRGAMLEGDFRFLTATSHGDIDATFLPDDRETGTDRGSINIKAGNSLSPNWYTNVDINRVSDTAFFQDFSEEPFGSAIGVIASTAGIYGRGRYWTAGGFAQVWQLTDPSLTDISLPYRRVPDVYFNWDQPLADHLELGVKTEAVKFEQPVLGDATRVDLYPYMAFPFAQAAWYLKPELGYRYTAYDLDIPVVPGGDTSPTRGVPIFDIDAGAYFDRDVTWFGHDFVNTLEPRLYYLRVPYRNQYAIPIFDTQDNTFSFEQLFRTNSFSGADRQTNADQLTAAVTSRLLDASDGSEWLSTSVGEITYFESPQVALPSEPIVPMTGSDYVVDTKLDLDDRWSVDGAYLYDPNAGQTDLASLRLQWRFGDGGLLNAMYRYRRDLVQEDDVSFAYPLNADWRVLGRWDYSVLNHSTVEALAGVEWQDCCMAVRVMARDYVHDTAGDKDLALFVEIQLTGLGAFGRATSPVLDRDILGYTQ